jgi:hypothetical protein
MGALVVASRLRALVVATPLLPPPLLPLVLASIAVALSCIGLWADSHTLPITTSIYECTAYQQKHAFKSLALTYHLYPYLLSFFGTTRHRWQRRF